MIKLNSIAVREAFSSAFKEADALKSDLARFDNSITRLQCSVEIAGDLVARNPKYLDEILKLRRPLHFEAHDQANFFNNLEQLKSVILQMLEEGKLTNEIATEVARNIHESKVEEVKTSWSKLYISAAEKFVSYLGSAFETLVQSKEDELIKVGHQPKEIWFLENEHVAKSEVVFLFVQDDRTQFNLDRYFFSKHCAFAQVRSFTRAIDEANEYGRDGKRVVIISDNNIILNDPHKDESKSVHRNLGLDLAGLVSRQQIRGVRIEDFLLTTATLEESLRLPPSMKPEQYVLGVSHKDKAHILELMKEKDPKVGTDYYKPTQTPTQSR